MDEKKTYKFKDCWCDEMEIKFVRAEYADNSRLFIGCLCKEEEDWNPYCDVTINLSSEALGEDCGFVDNECDPMLLNFMESRGWLEKTEMVGHSYYGSYPVVKFSKEFLHEVCIEMRY